MVSARKTILHIGDPIVHNPELYAELEKEFNIIRPSVEERQRDAFLEALRKQTWGNFDAVMRPFWNSGGEMGQWDEELIPLLPPNVKIFASAGAGYNWADVDVLAKHGIVYCNGASASSEAVADMALFHILSVFRNMTWSQLAARSCDPQQFLEAHSKAPLQSHNPRGHKLGIIGMGNIGFKIAQKAYAGLGMEIVYNDLFRKSAKAEAEIGATYHETMDEVLAVADCTVIATPFSGDKLLNAEKFAKFKKGSRLVNIARGQLLDEDALLEALESGRLQAAGLDVHFDEPNVNHHLAKMKNVTLTCHTAGGALETNIGFERLAMENVRLVLRGEDPLTPVNKHLLAK